MCTRTGWVYVGLSNVCCTAFGYVGAPFSVACLLINPETLIASRVAVWGAGGSRVPSVHTRVCDATHAIHVAASVAPRVSLCASLYTFNLAPWQPRISSGVTADKSRKGRNELTRLIRRRRVAFLFLPIFRFFLFSIPLIYFCLIYLFLRAFHGLPLDFTAYLFIRFLSSVRISMF